MARPKGGVIKFIAEAQKPKQKKKEPVAFDAVEIRRILHAGGEPTRDPCAQLLIHWRNLIAQRDDCAKRIAAKDQTVSKWTRKTLKRLNREIDETWQQIGVETWRQLGEKLAKLDEQQLADAFASLADAARPVRFPWHKEATRLAELAYLLDGNCKKSLLADSTDKTSGLKGKAVNLTTSKLLEQLHAQGHKTVTPHDLRRFVRDTLQVTLKSEQGKRHKKG